MAKKLSQLLLKEKTLPAIKTTTTFNAPGNYLPPYGKTTIRISGRGASSTDSTYAGTNPASYPYAGTNPASYPYAGTNPPTPGNAYYNYVAGNAYYNYVAGNVSGYNPDSQNQSSYQVVYAPSFYTVYSSYPYSAAYGSGCPSPYSYGGADYNVSVSYSCSSGSANYNPPTYPYAGTNPATYPYAGTNPSTPGNAYYNYVAGNAYYNYVAGNAYYNPSTAGSPANILGVSFPGAPAASPGSSGTLAPVVPTTSTTTQYSGSSISITVPTGGYVTIDNV